jgi:hypothetical protein
VRRTLRPSPRSGRWRDRASLPEPRPTSGYEGGLGPSNYKIILAVDHAFIGHEEDGLTDAVYLALADLELAWPASVAPVRIDDLELLCDAAEHFHGANRFSLARRDALADAARRVRHMLDRGSAA